jgi:hypothetical protein
MSDIRTLNVYVCGARSCVIGTLHEYSPSARVPESG